MTGSDAMSETDVLRAVDDSVSAIPAAPRPSAAQIKSRGRAQRRRAMLTTGVAAALLIGGASYWLTAALTPSGTAAAAGPTAVAGPAVALASVSGCPGIKAAIGTLEQVRGTSLMMKLASGRQVMVTTSAATMTIVQQAPLSAITNGEYAVVTGHRAGAGLAAGTVTLGPHTPPRNVTPPGIVTAGGTVRDVGAGGFTLVTSRGARVTVTTSSRTGVSFFHPGLAQFRARTFTLAIGRITPGGTLAAAIAAQPQAAGFKLTRIRYDACTPSALDTAVVTALLTSG